MSMMPFKLQQIRRSESGMVSIMTTMVLMIVISLVVLGFAQVSRRNQRESLDRQLSTQAFYAAESGVNDVRQLIETAVNNDTAISGKTSCSDNGTGGFYLSLNPDIDSAHNVKYSCVTVNTSPSLLRYSDVGTTSIIIPMSSGTGAPFNTITLNWQSKTNSSTPTAGCPTTVNSVFSPVSNWTCGYGVLRFDLVPTASNSLTADKLRDDTMTSFVVPFSSGGSPTIAYPAGSPASTNNTASLVGAKCTNSGCSLTINGLTSLNQQSYAMRISSIYQDVGLQISATDPSGGALPIQGAQVVIDSTGKAQDVLRRIQVNVPLRNNSQNQLSDFGLQSTDSICKRFSVMSGGYFATDVSGVTSSNPLCK